MSLSQEEAFWIAQYTINTFVSGNDCGQTLESAIQEYVNNSSGPITDYINEKMEEFDRKPEHVEKVEQFNRRTRSSYTVSSV